MKLSNVKSISYFKAHAAEILDDLREPWVITQNGEAKAVVQDIVEYERQMEVIAMLKILALGRREVEAGETESASAVVARLRDRPEP